MDKNPHNNPFDFEENPYENKPDPEELKKDEMAQARYSSADPDDDYEYFPKSEKNGKKPSGSGKKKKRKLRKEIRWFLSALVVIAAGLLIYNLLFAQNRTPASSDKDTPASDQTDQTETDQVHYTVLLDPGHGGYDSGKVSEDEQYYEKDITLSIAKKVEADLHELNPNITVELTRDSDEVDWPDNEIDDLTARVTKQTETDADIFVSIHCNAFEGDDSVKGYTLFVNSFDPFMNFYAEELDRTFTEAGWSQLDDIIQDNLLQVVMLSDVPSILIETGYMTNPEDLAGLLDDATQDKVARAIAESINTALTEQGDLLEASEKVYEAKRAERSGEQHAEGNGEPAANTENTPAA